MNEKTKIDDGGPAFPNVPGNPEYDKWDEGMSLRDWFAGQALIGVLGARNGFLVDVGIDNVGGWAYGVADAMLRSRKEKT